MKTWKIPPVFEGWRGGLERYKYVLLVIFLGMIFLIAPSEETTIQEDNEIEFDISAFERHLAENLSQIQGAGETRVVLTQRNDGQKIYAQDTQQEATGKNTSTTVTVGSGSSEQVVEVQQLYPQFQGALIVCQGGDNPTVQLQLIQAVSALTGLGSDCISVCKGNLS